MKEQGKDNAAKKMNEDDSKKAKKAARRSRKSAQHQFGFGGLPSSMDDVAKVTTQSDSGVARSIDVAPPMTNPLKTLPGAQPGSVIPPPSLFGGAKMNPSMLPAGRMAAPSSGRSRVVAAAARVEPNGWTFRDVPTLPERHPLEMTAVFVPHTDAPSVGERVASALRERSVAAVYDDAKAKASCKTMYGVEFRVRLYRGKGEKFGHGVIVEVQRRFGFSPAFAADARAVLDAAEGKMEATAPPPMPAMPSKLLPTVTDDDEDDFDDFDAPAPFSGGMKRPAPGPPSLLSISSAMLKRSKTADAAELALKGIADATDPNAVGPAAALRASRQLFEGEDTVAKDAISSLLVDDALEGIAEDQQDGAGAPIMPELRRHAVTAVSNSILNAATSSSTFLSDRSSFFADDVVPAVVSDLRQAESDPLTAAASARCLKGLVSGSRKSPAFRDDMKRVATECGAAEALEKALEAGQRGSSSLEQESRRCLEALS